MVFVECDRDFVQHLRERFAKADIVEADARDLRSILSDRGIDRADAIISSLPSHPLSRTKREALLRPILQCLNPEGVFVQASTIAVPILGRAYRRYFSSVRYRPVPLDLPPGGVYACSRLHSLPRL